MLPSSACASRSYNVVIDQARYFTVNGFLCSSFFQFAVCVCGYTIDYCG
uniref:Uncharacterized protein n=1 Tax=Picea glauca TaxID=3330 RepID=A0A117NHI7_PICGL|nr:hypothetical protein ABT39_MTgene4472 [Picea glauca]